MIRLTSNQRKYIVGETGVAVAINALLSLGFALLTSHGVASMRLWGAHGMAVDFAPQVFMITFATTLAATLATRARIRSGKVAPLERAQAGWLARGPRNALLRAIVFGLAVVLILAPLSAAALYGLGFDSLGTAPFVAMKVIYGAVLAVLLAPPVIRAALAAPDRQEKAFD